MYERQLFSRPHDLKSRLGIASEHVRIAYRLELRNKEVARTYLDNTRAQVAAGIYRNVESSLENATQVYVARMDMRQPEEPVSRMQSDQALVEEWKALFG